MRRLLAARPTAADPNDLSRYELRVLSHRGEDGIVHELLRRLGFPTRRSVELGCGSNGGNSGLLVACFDYTGLMVDGNPRLVEVAQELFRNRPVEVVSAWITTEGVNDLLAGHGLTGEVDYLSIDVDGMDFWIWEALTVVDPLLVVAEFNVHFGPVLRVTVAYKEDFDRHDREQGIPKGYFGASIAALSAFASRRGYRLVASCGGNGFFLKDGLCPELRTLTPEEAWAPHWKRPHLYEKIRRVGVERYFAEAGWPLVKVG